MYRTYILSPEHYASKWPASSDTNIKNDRNLVNQTAVAYADAQDGPAKEALCLQLIQYFHGYLLKFVTMVVNGTIPSAKSAAGKDALNFLEGFRKKNATQQDLMSSCRTLHLAFKSMSTEDIYDIMVDCFLRALNYYDPHYTVKVQQICEIIKLEYRDQQEFTTEAVSESVGFDANRCLRMLVRNKYLVSVKGARKKIRGYTRGPAWPPSPKFLSVRTFGFTNFVRRWFKFYLDEYIQNAMRTFEIRQNANILQLEHRASLDSNSDSAGALLAMPNANGNFTDSKGVSWDADTDLMHLQLDVSAMTDAWVRETSDRLFRKLTPRERKLLQLVYRFDFNWVQLGEVFNCTDETVHTRFVSLIEYLRARAGVTPGVVEDPTLSPE